MSKILGLLLIHISGTGIMSFSQGSFVLYVEDALHFKRSAFFLVGSFTVLFSCLSLPLFKKAESRFSPSFLVNISAFFESANYLGFSYFESYPVFLLLGILNGIFINGISSPLIIEVLNHEFPKKSSKLLAVILSSSTFFSAFFINILKVINESFSFRWGYRLIAFSGLFFALAGSFLIRGTSFEHCMPAKEYAGLKDKELFCFCLILFLGNFANLALFNNLIPFLTEIGVKRSYAQSLSSLVVFAVALSRLFWGRLFQKKNAVGVLFLLTLSPLAASLLFFFSYHIELLIYPSLLFISFNACFNALPAQSISSQIKKEGSLTFLLFSSILGSSLGSSTAAFIYDIMGSYKTFWLFLIAASLSVSLINLWLLRQYPHDGTVVSG